MKRKLTKLISTVLSATLVVGLMPAETFAAATETTTEVYEGTSDVIPDGGDFTKYPITVSVTKVNGVITKVEYKTSEFGANAAYAKKAMNTVGTRIGLADQIIAANGTEGVDTISGATCSSDAIIEAVNKAVQVSTATVVDKTDLKSAIDQSPADNSDERYRAASWTAYEEVLSAAQSAYKNESTTAAEADAAQKALEDARAALVENEIVYVTMNVPYSDFYAAENVSEQVDVISTATTNKFKGTTGLAKGTYNDGTNICGVTYPVAMNMDTYEALKETVTDASADYYFTAYEGTPAAYKTLSVQDGTYVFSAAASEAEKDVSALRVTDFTTESSYGNYQITLEGVLTAGGVTIGEENPTIAGVILTTSDGKNYPMYTLENTWLGTKVDYVELAWSVKDAPAVYKSHGSGPAFYQYDMNGKTLTNVKLITDLGIYNISCEQKLTQYTDEEAAGIATSDTTIDILNLPADIENAKVDVYYNTEQTGNHGTQTVRNDVATDLTIVDGSVTLPETWAQDEEGNDRAYFLYITSDNYAQISGAVQKADTIYAKMNIPYTDFYTSQQVSEQVDVISTATTSKFKGTTGLAKGSYNDGTDICGIVYPVAIAMEDYLEVRKLEKENGDYKIISGLSDKPVAYMEVSVNDATPVFKLVSTDKDATGLSVTDFTTESSYGNYQITLDGILTAGGVTINNENAVIAGVVLTTSDGMTYPMYVLENTWLGTKVDYVELAWSVKGAPAVYKAHGSGSAFYQYDMNGKTLTNVEVITDIGTYNIACNQVLTPFYESILAVVVSDTELTVSGVPADAANTAVSLTYKEGEGRTAVTKTVATTYAGGKLTLTDSRLVTGITYTITVTCDNYGPVTASLVYDATAVLPGETNDTDKDTDTDTVTAPVAPTSVKAASAAYNKIKITWNKVSDASGYEVYQYNSSSKKYEKVKTLTAASYTKSGLTTGKTYKFKVRAYKTVNGTTVYGAYSKVVSAKPALSKATSVKVKNSKSKTAVLSWKKVAGASGYVVYRSTKKSSGYKAVTTVKKGSKVSYTNKTLKKGTTYYYKVKAYRTVNGKKVYAAASSVVKVKIKK